MNPIQKLWLKVLNPWYGKLVNEKLAKRSGLLGKIGKFFSLGPRQFGYHPINRYVAVVNNLFLKNIPFNLHRYSFVKHLNENGYISARPYAIPSLMGMLVLFYTFVTLVIPSDFHTQEGTTLEVLTNAGLPAHYSSLNDRVSAHYTQINSLYHWEMLKRIEQKSKQIQRNRISQNDKTKKTRFARKGYQYVQAHTKTQQ